MWIIDRILHLVRSKELRESMWKFMVLQALIIVLAVSISTYLSTYSAMQKQAISFSNEILKMKASDIDSYIEGMEQQSQYILQQLSVYKVLDSVKNLDKRDPYYDAVASGLLSDSDSDELETVMDAMVTGKEIQSVAILDNDGTIWAYDNHGSKDLEIQTILDTEEISNLMRLANDSDGGLEAHLYSLDSNENILFFTRCIYSPEDYKQVGYLMLIANMDSLADILASGIDNESFDIMVYTDDGEPVYKGQNEVSTTSILSFINKNIAWQVNNTEGVLFVRALSQNEKWSVVSTQKLSRLLYDVISFRKITIGLSLIIIFIFTVASWHFAKSIVQPILAVTDAMHKFREGVTNVDVTTDREDELGYLTHSFNEMVQENKRLVNDIYREQITKKEAELQALQSQINPHFLFNTLETISWKARLSHVDDISEMVEDLSDIMKVSIGKSSAMTELKQEMLYIKKYLDIMEKRFGDRLTVKQSIDESLNSYMVPRLLIQPIIENAIYHGIEKSRRGGIIFVSAKEYNDFVRIQVCNTGTGIPKEVVEQINIGLQRASDEYFYNLNSDNNHNVGLENVNRRIKLFYGEEYGVELKSKYGYYSNVIMYLPRKAKEEGETYV